CARDYRYYALDYW
nr:immunoglobulin heavy chain junction region [Mus musculus]MBK4185801.1 immunoglobulin heavy chain junction region [Mus musculus]